MPGEAIVLDPVSEDAANAELALSAANGYDLLEHSYPVPEEDALWAGSIDTEGERKAGARVLNREIPIRLRLSAATDAAFRTAQRNLDKKLAKLRAEGGTYKRTLPNGDVIVFDVETVAGGERLFDNRFIHSRRTEDTIRFICRPYGRGPDQTFSAVTETALPVLRITAAGIKGDVDALGKLLIDEQQGQDQWWLHWGVRSRYYSSDPDNALFYEAEGRTPLGGAGVVTGTAPASGGGTNNVVRQGTLTPGWQAMLSTQASGGGNHLKHIGIYEVWARVLTPAANVGALSIRLDWAEGDFRAVTQNPAVVLTTEPANTGRWLLVNLGQVVLKKAVTGTQRWEGRIVARVDVAGADLDVDCLWLLPISDGRGRARALPGADAPTSFVFRDEFDQPGALAGKTAPVGGTWAAAGNPTGLTVASGTAQRSTTTEADHHFALAGTNVYAAIVVQADVWAGAGVDALALQGVLARYVDINNWVVLDRRGAGISLRKWVGGVETLLAFRSFSAGRTSPETLRLSIDTSGRCFCWSGAAGTAMGAPLITARDPDLAAGGALASGRIGIYDHALSQPAAVTRSYDNFLAFAPATDAAVFANQSLALRHDSVIREDPAGALWTPVSDYEGDYLRIPSAGMEGRTAELLVKASRNDPDTMDDPAIDDIRGTLTVTPRYWRVPEP